MSAVSRRCAASAGRETAVGVEQRGDERLADGEEHEEQQQAGDDHDNGRDHGVAREASAPRDRPREHHGEGQQRDPRTYAERQPARAGREAGRERPQHGKGRNAGGGAVQASPREQRRTRGGGDERPERRRTAVRPRERRRAAAERPRQHCQCDQGDRRDHRGQAVAVRRHEHGTLERAGYRAHARLPGPSRQSAVTRRRGAIARRRALRAWAAPAALMPYLGSFETSLSHLPSSRLRSADEPYFTKS